MRNPGKPAGWSRPLADFVDPCVAPVLEKQGFGTQDLVTVWTDIVGERIASYAEPIRLKWPRGRRSPDVAATLLLRVEGGGALELQHMQTAVLERINAHLGWRCVGRLAMQQAPLLGRPRRRTAPPAPADGAVASAAAATAGIEDAGLRDALVRLGARVVKAR